MNTLLSTSLEWTVSSWKRFRLLPQEEKNRYKLDGFHRDFADPGYMRKSEEQGGYDNKEFLHHLPFIANLYQMEGTNNFAPEFSDLMTALNELSRVLRSQMEAGNFRPLLENEEQDSLLNDLMVKSLGLLTIRLLGYDPGPLEKEIASEHVDKSGLTHHLYSSHPGLQKDVGGPGSRKWEDVDIPSKQLLVFGGHQLCAWSNQEIRPLVHQVISKTEESRDSVVVFTPFVGVLRIKKEKRMQEMMKEYGF